MDTHYDVLELKATCTQEEIKRAFRRRAKELHPDVSAPTDRSLEEMRRLILAYETLIDPRRRREYDRTHFIYRDDYKFDYRSFLRGRKDDPFSQSKLVFFDLLHNHADDAIDLYDSLSADSSFDLSEYLDREDFMDCAFLLAEEYERKGQYVRAYNLLITIVRCEFAKPYFRHFLREVTDRLKAMVCLKMPQVIGTRQLLRYLDELIAFGFSRKDTAFFLKKAAELHSELEEIDAAAVYLQRGLELDDKLTGVKKLKEKIGLVD